MTEYIIVGDTKNYTDCLIYACGTLKEHAIEVLNRILNNPTRDDKYLTRKHNNIRIKTITKDEKWW